MFRNKIESRNRIKNKILKLTIDDILSEKEEETVVEVIARLEKWEMFDSPNDFNRSEELWKILY